MIRSDDASFPINNELGTSKWGTTLFSVWLVVHAVWIVIRRSLEVTRNPLFGVVQNYGQQAGEKIRYNQSSKRFPSGTIW